MTTSEPSSPTRSIQSNTSDDCFICMEKTEDPVVNVLDFDIARSCQCNAKLHTKCYINWLRTSVSCPICRTPIPHPDDNYQRELPNVMVNSVTPHGSFAFDRLPNYIIIPEHRRTRTKLLIEYFCTVCGIILVVGLIIIFSSKI